MRSLLLTRRVAVALLLQVVGYAALLNLVANGQPTSLVASFSAVPTVVLVVFAIPALPAYVITVVLGAILAVLGLPPESLPAVALARGDLVFLASAYAVGVASAWANRRADAMVG